MRGFQLQISAECEMCFVCSYKSIQSVYCAWFTATKSIQDVKCAWLTDSNQYRVFNMLGLQLQTSTECEMCLVDSYKSIQSVYYA